MASGPFGATVRAAGLERASRYAGEAFGHEEAAPAASRGWAIPSWSVWLVAAAVAIIGLAALSLR